MENEQLMKNRIYLTFSVYDKNETWKLTEKVGTVYDQTWLDWMYEKANINIDLKQKIVFLTQKDVIIVRCNKKYFIEFNNDKEYLEYCLKFNGVFDELETQ
jgi:hypothetical protein